MQFLETTVELAVKSKKLVYLLFRFYYIIADILKGSSLINIISDNKDKAACKNYTEAVLFIQGFQ